MKKEQLSEAIGKLDDEMIEEAMERRVSRPHRWKSLVAVAACVCVLAGCLLAIPLLGGGPGTVISSDHDCEGVPTDYAPTNTTTHSSDGAGSEPSRPVDPSRPSVNGEKIFLMAEPTLPAMAKRPVEWDDGAYTAWRESVMAQQKQVVGQTGGMTEFYTRTMETFLAGEAGENRVYSPLNLYLALSMLAETANGDSRAQLLDLLGINDLPTLRKKNSALWNGVYLDDGAVTSKLANSLWLAEGDRWSYRQDSIDRLAKDYYASVFKGVMGDAAYDAALQSWINEQTKGLLEEQAGSLGFDPNTVLALASTICLQAKWTDEFDPEETETGWFHTSYGNDVNCEFMNKHGMGFAYVGDKFTGVSLGLDEGYRMFFFLPDKGNSVESLFQNTDKNAQVMEILQAFDRTELGGFVQIQMSIPKFDVASDRDFKEGLKALGITDVFDAQKGDFTGVLASQDEPVFVSKVQHAARVAIDEEGVTAAAYTVAVLDGMGAGPNEVVEFIADRPFMFAITGPGNTLLFSGIVETPTEA